jgi:arginase
MSARVTVLRGRTSDRSADGARGAQALGEALAARLGVQAELVGEPGTPRDGRWEDDLRDGREAIAAAGTALEAALDAGAFPVLLASDCTICIGSLPVLARREPATRIVWLDAHGDFNTPDTTASGFLGGMCLSAPCGRWDAGFGGGVDPHRVVVSDARDLDAAEREEIDRAGVRVVAPARVAEEVRRERVFLHLDLDILDPEVMPAAVPAPGGLGAGELRSLLAGVAGAAELIGVEVTAFEAPEDSAERERLAALIAGILEPVLPIG